MGTFVTVDTEWGYRDGRVGAETSWEPVVLVARVDGVNHHFAGREDRLSAFVHHHRDCTWVAHAAAAEMRYLSRLGIPLPPQWWCTQVGWRSVSNRSGHIESSLVAALRGLELQHLIPAQKEEIRDRILRLEFSPADWPAVVAYCTADVIATETIYRKLVAGVDPVAMAYWTEFLRVVAQIEGRGIRIDTGTLERIWRYRIHLQDQHRERANQIAPVYRRDGSFSRTAFWRWVDSLGIRWPLRRNDRGQWCRSMDDNHLEMMQGRHDGIRQLRRTRKTIRSLQSFPMLVDAGNGRHYHSILPFRSVTGRNQPRKFVFGAPKWMRSLVIPDPGHVLAYADYRAEEIGIAAALSGDVAMWRMYQADDPHLAFAVMAGAAPEGATKDTHKAIRRTYKVLNLAVLYGQGAESVSARLGVDVDEAVALLRQHRRLFARYHSWSDTIANVAYQRGYATTRQGWRATVTTDTRWRTWANFPIQGAGAEIMRLTSIAMSRQGVDIRGIVHDGWLVSMPAGEEVAVREVVMASAAWASRQVLGETHPLRMDWKEYRDRYEEDDRDSREEWEFICSALPKEVIRVPSE